MTKIAIDRAVVEQALGALVSENSLSAVAMQQRMDAITVLRAALVEPVQEPVAKVELMTTGGNAGLATRIVEIDDHLRERLRPGQLLYTAPPQRKPLPLKTVEKLIYENTKINPNVADDRELLGYIVNAVRAIERAHGIGE